jgi:hypothetical protein
MGVVVAILEFWAARWAGGSEVRGCSGAAAGGGTVRWWAGLEGWLASKKEEVERQPEAAVRPW